MFSYQHAFHAGNVADLHKHEALARLVSLLTRKDRGLSYVETHAGRGLYDLEGPDAQKTRESAAGIVRHRATIGEAYAAACDWVRTDHGPSAYPGSPLIARHFLRDQDRLVLMEKHPQELAALRRAFRHMSAEIHDRDGYEGVLGIAPLDPRKGLVLIDPSYEVKSEYGQVARFVPELLRKWPQASILLWYPILTEDRHREMLSAIEGLAHLRHEVRFTGDSGVRMKGSGLMLVNPPYGAAPILDDMPAPYGEAELSSGGSDQ